MINLLFVLTATLFMAGQVRSLIILILSRKKSGQTKPYDLSYNPSVLIQIPVYNEGWEVKDAVLSALRQEYKKDKLAVQIIDDSLQDFPDLVIYLEDEARNAGVKFSYLRRDNRHGYKAGALNYGMRFSDHELIAVLDADFVLQTDFLQDCVCQLRNENIAGVQTRWSYRNQFANSVTSIQATIFETIFALEQNARKNMGYPALFTGTSGIWKRAVVNETGGWRETPFTAEDIDLGYRSYHLGYNFIYIDEPLSSCEATVSFLAFKQQQQRWARGVWQAGLQNIGNIKTARQSAYSKIIEWSTILYNLTPLFILFLGILTSLQILSVKRPDFIVEKVSTFVILLIFIGPGSWGIAYSIGKYQKAITIRQRLMMLDGFLLGIGLAWAAFLGICETLMQSKKEFIVTPKGKNGLFPKQKRKTWLSTNRLIFFLELSTFIYFSLVGFKYLFSFPIQAIYFFVIAAGGLFSSVTSFTEIYRSVRRSPAGSK